MTPVSDGGFPHCSAKANLTLQSRTASASAGRNPTRDNQVDAAPRVNQDPFLHAVGHRSHASQNPLKFVSQGKTRKPVKSKVIGAFNHDLLSTRFGEEPKKSAWGALTGVWVPHDTRDELIDHVRCWSERTEIPTERFITWTGISASKFYGWRNRYGRVNEHNGWVPRDWWLLDWEKHAIIDDHDRNPLEGYRRLTFMMLDSNVVAVSPSSMYRVLRNAGRLQRDNTKASLKGTGFDQPLGPHQHWHIDIAYINACGTFFFLCTVLDGYCRFNVHGEIRPNMGEAEVETIIQRARERYPDVHPRIISDNGPQLSCAGFLGIVA
jgi:putative transposase